MDDFQDGDTWSKGERIDILTLISKFQDVDDYLDVFMAGDARAEPVPHDPGTPLPSDVDITFLDAPGIEDTNGSNIEHAPKITQAMAGMRAFNSSSSSSIVKRHRQYVISWLPTVTPKSYIRSRAVTPMLYFFTLTSITTNVTTTTETIGL